MGDWRQNACMGPIRASLARPRVLAGLLFIYLAVSAALVSFRGVSQVRDAWRHSLTTDFGPFYAAGGLVLTSHRGALYRDPFDVPERYARAPRNYFNPPLFALVYSPLTLFSLSIAHKVLSGLLASSVLGLVALAYYWRPERRVVVVAGLASASFWPVYETIRLGHISLLFALASGLCLVAFERPRPATAGILVALLGLKPSIAFAPFAFLAWSKHRRALVVAVTGIGLLVLAPFALLGPGSLLDYLGLLRDIGHDSFTLRGRVSGGAAFMFNWNGFFARLLRGDVSPAVVLPFDLATAALMLKVWTHGDVRSSWLALTLATLLALPHMLWYDWVLLLPPAFALVLARPTLTLMGLLVALHFCVNVSTLQFENLDLDSFAVFLATPVAFLLLAYMAFEDSIDRLLARRRVGNEKAVPEAALQ
jgi:hypothetical protein